MAPPANKKPAAKRMAIRSRRATHSIATRAGSKKKTARPADPPVIAEPMADFTTSLPMKVADGVARFGAAAACSVGRVGLTAAKASFQYLLPVHAGDSGMCRVSSHSTEEDKLRLQIKKMKAKQALKDLSAAKLEHAVTTAKLDHKLQEAQDKWDREDLNFRGAAEKKPSVIRSAWMSVMSKVKTVLTVAFYMAVGAAVAYTPYATMAFLGMVVNTVMATVTFAGAIVNATIGGAGFVGAIANTTFTCGKFAVSVLA